MTRIDEFDRRFSISMCFKNLHTANTYITGNTICNLSKKVLIPFFIKEERKG